VLVDSLGSLDLPRRPTHVVSRPGTESGTQSRPPCSCFRDSETVNLRGNSEGETFLMKTKTNLLKQSDLVWSGLASRNIIETPFYLQTHLQIDEGLSIPSSLQRIESLLAEPWTRAKNLWVELPWQWRLWSNRGPRAWPHTTDTDSGLCPCML